MKAQIRKSSQQAIKEGNSRLIFNTLLQYQPISRAGIKKITKLSATTVSVLVEELIAEGLVEERGFTDTTEVGRKGILLALRPQGAFFLGIEITNTAIKSDLYDLSFKVKKSYLVEFHGASELTLKLLELVESAQNLTEGKLYGISIGVPAVVDYNEQRVVSSTVLEFVPDRKLIELVSDVAPDSYVCLYNDSGFVAFAEKEQRRNVRNLFSVDISDGVGSGLIIDGELFTGRHGQAGEFGHICVDYNGERCCCGSRGCLENMVNVRVILQKIAKAKGVSAVTMDDALAMLAAGDEAALSVLNETARILSFAINSVINLFDPELVVISGAIREFDDYILEPLKENMAKKKLRGRQVVVELSKTQGNGVTLGGAYYAFRNCFSQQK